MAKVAAPKTKPLFGDSAKVEVSMGVTVNMGNYESLRYDLGITLPCATNEIDATKKYLEEQVLKAIQQKTKEFRALGGIDE